MSPCVRHARGRTREMEIASQSDRFRPKRKTCSDRQREAVDLTLDEIISKLFRYRKRVS